MGYHRAGFTEIVGVDNRPMPRYPLQFVQADALEYVADHGREFDVIHASPPCQAYSALKSLHRDKSYPDLIEKTRAILIKTGKVFVIENVPGAPLISPVMLCGSFFDLGVWRHRIFETSFQVASVPWCCHKKYPNPIDVSGTGSAQHGERKKKTGGKCRKPRDLQEARQAMGIDWMNRKEISQAIPPAYTEFIGIRLLDALSRVQLTGGNST